MSLLLVGLSHRTAPVEVRERYAVPSSELGMHDEKLVASGALDEAVLISTCNRTELVATAREAEAALDELRRFLHEAIGDGSAAPDQVYELEDAEAVRHVFEVSASLDSMVVGEAQILGQVKHAYRAAVAARSCGPVLNRLFQLSFRAGKRVRSETGLSHATTSVARVGVQLAREIFDPFAGKRVLLLGAGDMAESALLGLRDAGARDVTIANRTASRAARLAARLGARARPLEELELELTGADVLLCSLEVDAPLVETELLSRVMGRRQGQPLLVIDLGLPRNVDPAAQELENLYLYDIDDLETVAQQGRAAREQAIEPARRIVAQERARFERWQAALPLVPTIRELHALAERLARAEARRNAWRLGATSEETREVVERLADAIAAKILHRPLERLRAEAEDGSAYYAEAVRHLFGLEEEDE